jgi:hypothetical protein
MILNFMQKVPNGPLKGWETNFVRKIKEGVKVTTIRADAKNRWKTGNKIHFCTGGYKPGRVFHEGVASDVQKISITWNRSNEFLHLAKVVIGNSKPMFYEVETKTLDKTFIKSKFDFTLGIVAENDGFDNVDDFFKYFNMDFEGNIIFWGK